MKIYEHFHVHFVLHSLCFRAEMGKMKKTTKVSLFTIYVFTWLEMCITEKLKTQVCLYAYVLIWKSVRLKLHFIDDGMSENCQIDGLSQRKFISLGKKKGNFACQVGTVDEICGSLELLWADLHCFNIPTYKVWDRVYRGHCTDKDFLADLCHSLYGVSYLHRFWQSMMELGTNGQHEACIFLT